MPIISMFYGILIRMFSKISNDTIFPISMRIIKAKLVATRLSMANFLRLLVKNNFQLKTEFTKITNRGYFVEWDCGADLSADTIEARWICSESTQMTASA